MTVEAVEQMSRIALVTLPSLLFLADCSGCAWAEATPSEAAQFLAQFEQGRFSELYRRALGTFCTAEEQYQHGDYERAAAVLEELWAEYPPSCDAWRDCRNEAAKLSRELGINVGLPPCYYALRMLTECARWRRDDPAAKAQQLAPHTATLRVVLVGKARGVEPTTWAELENGTGRDVEHVLCPELLEGDHRIIRQSLWLFCEYMLAATRGKLRVETEVLHLPDLCVPVRAVAKPYRHAGLGGGAWEMIWGAVLEDVKARTDWWWVLYPSHVPEQYADFETTEFITGGMGLGPDGASPCFIIDDRWLVRKPPHLGKGPYTDIERRAYLPQWLQHEFFHHLFRTYPEFKLEEKGHQWFDRATWPEDFEGRFEPDYYHEALHKRLQPRAEPPMHVALRYTPPPKELFLKLTIPSLIGDYRHEPVQNDWHIGAIKLEKAGDAQGGPVLRWTNRAGASWQLFPDLENGVLRTGRDNPYYESNPTSGRVFRVILRRDNEGEWLPEVIGFQFQGGLYALQPK